MDLYVGGVEHAVLHLLYSRFWHKVLYDLGYVSAVEPFRTLFNQGYIQAYAYRDDARPVRAGRRGGRGRGVGDRLPLAGRSRSPSEYGKIGKSLKNVVTPDEMYAAYGADTFRLYEMSMGPLDLSRPWDTRAVVGSQRFLQRLWRNVVDEVTGEVTVVDVEPDVETLRVLNRAVDEVRTEMQAMRFNTAIARVIVLNNHLTGLDRVPRAVAETLVLLVAPVRPAHRRGAVVPARATSRASPTSRSRPPTRPTWSRRP